jgi:DNA-binding CsgD family transcriptional regulator
MNERSQTLTEREKETLRLLLAGHDAKSAASALGLSVHTVNERLREARRKLGVGSSREAARTLARAEGPNFLGDKQLGVVQAAAPGPQHRPSDQRRRLGAPLVWLSGGMVMMLAMVAAVAMTMAPHGDGKTSPAKTPVAYAAADPASDKASVEFARSWAKLLDDKRWADSWKTSGAFFQSQIEEARWTETARTLRQSLGAAGSRSVKSVSSARSLPGVPDGDYKIIQFATAFANKADAVETVVLAKENGDWKIYGYFIR